MNTKSLLDFLSELEEMRKACNPEDMVRDSCGTYPKAQILSCLISDAKHLIKYGEYKIALENLLDNLAEYELKLDDETLEIAACAFGNNISTRNKKALADLKKDEINGISPKNPKRDQYLEAAENEFGPID